MTGVNSIQVMSTTTHPSIPLSIAPRERLRDRLIARLRAPVLDRALANGTPPETSAALALRAQRITNRSRRRHLAGTIRRLNRRRRGAVPLQVTAIAGRVAAADDELSRLAEALERPEPVAARGVAQALLLLTDGSGPLYNRRSEDRVAARAATAAANLSPDPA